MPIHRYLITGATGFVGSHLAEACVALGHQVTALVRPDSDTSSLEHADVTIVRGNLTDPVTVARAVAGVDLVVHCAAKVGDWGPVEDYRAVNVEGLRTVLEACRGQPIQRIVHISTLGVYAARHHHGTDETEPLPTRHIDGYTQTKAEAERLALQYERDYQLPVVVLRPGFIYGPRDRTVLPRLVAMLRSRQLGYFGRGQQALNTIYVGNLVDAIFRAIESTGAVGRVYNLTDGEYVSKKRFIDTIATTLDLPRPGWVPVPFWLARLLAGMLEGAARWWGAVEAPPLTQARLKFIGLNLDFSIERARRELGYQPRTSFDRGMAATLAWFKEYCDLRLRLSATTPLTPHQ